jgi:hypothetical protein
VFSKILQVAVQKAKPEVIHKQKRAASGVEAPNAALTKVPIGEATMAANEVTKKLRIYHTLYRLNVSFTNIINRCQTLRDGGVLNAKQLKLFLGYTKELQAEINEGVLDTLSDVEFNDWTRFGKVREKEEKRLRDPNDVFIQAKERRQELRQKKRTL